MAEHKLCVALYCRTATNNQLDDLALAAQSTRLHQYAADNGLEITGEVWVYEKGIVMDRPGWNSVLRLAASKQADAILVTELGRVARDPWTVVETMQELSAQNLTIYFSDINLACNTGIAARMKQISIAMAQV